MKTNENIPADAREDVIKLGVVSTDTKGGAFNPGEVMGLTITPGISEE